MRTRSHMVLLVVVATGCWQERDSIDPRMRALAERHGPHLEAIATALAPACPNALASTPEDGELALPILAEGPSPAIPSGSLFEDEAVLQVAVACRRDNGQGVVIASQHDIFAKGRGMLPPSGCAEQVLPSSTTDRLTGCLGRTEPPATSLTLSRPIDGGTIDVFASAVLGR